MSETTLFDDGWASIQLDEDLYPQDAVKGAAYVLLERAYVFLERAADQRILVRVKAKAGDTTAVAGEFENEALAQAYRRRIATARRQLIEGITARAIAGAAGPPGLDDLLDMDIGAETAFDDPLGIAMSWEEKYTKKKGEKAGAATGPDTPEPGSPVASSPAASSPAASSPTAGSAAAGSPGEATPEAERDTGRDTGREAEQGSGEKPPA